MVMLNKVIFGIDGDVQIIVTVKDEETPGTTVTKRYTVGKTTVWIETNSFVYTVNFGITTIVIVVNTHEKINKSFYIDSDTSTVLLSVMDRGTQEELETLDENEI